MEQTFVMIKPDGVKRGLVDEIISRYEKAGLRIVKKKKMRASLSLLEKHYPDSMAEGLGEKAAKAGVKVDDLKKHGMKVLKVLREYIMSGPVIALVLEGENAIQRVREVTGYTDPATAEKGTIRGDFGDDSLKEANEKGRACRNLIHASGNKEEADREIRLWFG